MIGIEELICGFIVGVSIGATVTLLAVVLNKFHIYEAAINKEILVDEKTKENPEEKDEVKAPECCSQSIAD